MEIETAAIFFPRLNVSNFFDPLKGDNMNYTQSSFGAPKYAPHFSPLPIGSLWRRRVQRILQHMHRLRLAFCPRAWQAYGPKITSNVKPRCRRTIVSRKILRISQSPTRLAMSVFRIVYQDDMRLRFPQSSPHQSSTRKNNLKPPRKRPRLASPKLKTTTRAELLWKFVEALDVRITRLEAQRGDEDFQARNYAYEPSNAAALAVRVSSLETSAGIKYNLRPTIIGPSGQLYCPIRDCFRKYKAPADLNEHIKHKHEPFDTLVKQQACNPCDKNFHTPSELILICSYGELQVED